MLESERYGLSNSELWFNYLRIVKIPNGKLDLLLRREELIIFQQISAVFLPLVNLPFLWSWRELKIISFHGRSIKNYFNNYI